MLSKEEIEKTKDRIKILLKDDCNCPECIKNKKAYETLLKYIEQLEQENKKQNKIIGEMSKYLAEISDCPREMFKIDLDCEERCGDKDTDIKCWKLYFEEKVDDKNVENKR